jgi:carbon-monoxide dehydrogenase iron sulfur subunit
MQTVFVNPERCIGCLQCELACAVEHSASRDESLAFLEQPVPRKRIHVEPGPAPTLAFPNRCRHCDPAPCLQVCPSGAITRDDGFGLVLVEPKRCIGCAMCAVVCPFDVVTFHPLAGGPDLGVAVAVKCDGCVDRLRDGGEPACAEICKVDALVFGDLNELVAAGSLREAGAVLAASGATAAPPPGGDPLAVWREWGLATEAAATAAAVWDPGRHTGDGRVRENGAGGGTTNADGEQGGTS